MAQHFFFHKAHGGAAEDQEEFALTMNGKKTNLRRNDFLTFAETCEIPRKAAETMVQKMIDNVPGWLSICKSSLLPEDLKTSLTELIQNRTKRIDNEK